MDHVSGHDYKLLREALLCGILGGAAGKGVLDDSCDGEKATSLLGGGWGGCPTVAGLLRGIGFFFGGGRVWSRRYFSSQC